MARNTGIFRCFTSCVYTILKILNGIQHKKNINLRETSLNCSTELSMWHSRFLNLNKVSICSVVQESPGKLPESKSEEATARIHMFMQGSAFYVGYF